MTANQPSDSDYVPKQKTNPFLKESPIELSDKDPGQTSSSKTVNDEKTRILQKPPSGGARERERGDMDLYQGDRRTVSELLKEAFSILTMMRMDSIWQREQVVTTMMTMKKRRKLHSISMTFDSSYPQ